MSYKKIAAIVLVILMAAIGGLIYLRDHVLQQGHDMGEITDISNAYQADEEIAAAKEKLQAGIEPVQVITTLPEGANCVAIVIDGLPDRSLTARLIDVLEKHHAEATFFVEGQNAADEPEAIRLIRDKGFELGNYTLIGLAGLDKVSQDEQLEELCRTQKILNVRSAFTPTLFRAPRTVYTDELLQTAHAAGLSYAVKENIRFKKNTLPDDAAAAAYAEGIPDGSIIAVEIGRPVERRANTSGDIDERPAVDMKPTIHDDERPKTEQTTDIADELDRLLTALEQRGFKVLNVNGFRKIHYIPANAAAVAAQASDRVKDAVQQETTAGGEDHVQ